MAGTADVITAPWISSLATRGSKLVGGQVGNFQASVTLSGVGAPDHWFDEGPGVGVRACVG
jgi:hypothetical protein